MAFAARVRRRRRPGSLLIGYEAEEAMKRCEECGFTFDEPVGEAPRLIRQRAQDYRAILTESGHKLRARPREGVWSPLEYAAHVRDIFALFERRVRAITACPGTGLEVMDHDAEVAAGGYNQLNPASLAGDLVSRAERLAGTLEGLRAEQWLLYGFRQGERRTIEEITQRALHEAQHHLADIKRQA